LTVAVIAISMPIIIHISQKEICFMFLLLLLSIKNNLILLE